MRYEGAMREKHTGKADLVWSERSECKVRTGVAKRREGTTHRLYCASVHNKIAMCFASILLLVVSEYTMSV